MTFCPCNTFNEIASGGLSAGSSATVVTDIREGGVSAGGSASVWMGGNTWDGFAAVWPLSESSTGAAGEFVDLTANNLDGTGGGGNTSFLTSLDAGVFCLDSQLFANRDFIHFPRDTITGEFSVSMWIKRTDNSFGERWFFSRGVDTATTKWNFALGLSYVGQLHAKLQLNDDPDEVARVYSSSKLISERWYHVAATWTPQDKLKLYLDGVLVDETDTEQASIVAFSGTNHSQAGKLNTGGSFQGNIQEIRLKPAAETAAYFLAEHDNFCNPTFYSLGSTIDEAVFT